MYRGGIGMWYNDSTSHSMAFLYSIDTLYDHNGIFLRIERENWGHFRELCMERGTSNLLNPSGSCS